MVITSVAVMGLMLGTWSLDAWARAGGGKSSGSRGSRSSSAPAERMQQPAASAPQAGAQAGSQAFAPQRSSWMSGLMGGVTGFLIGGAIGSMLLGGFGGGGLFGGIGFLEILLIGGVLYFAFAYMRRRQQPATASPYGYSVPQDTTLGSWPSTPQTGAAMMPGGAVVEDDLSRGLRHIQQMDSSFTPEGFASTASEVFFNVQEAWMVRDMSSVRTLLAPEMYDTLQRECERLRAEGRVNYLDHISMRSVQVTEAWQESGQDFVTVHLLASLMDYTIDESSKQVVEGSRTSAITFEEYWTFVRPVGPNAWKLSAIQQAR
ncbi:MAG: Tim44 domain-containing protein [Candidatus Tectimicrobiota bacterium]